MRCERLLTYKSSHADWPSPNRAKPAVYVIRRAALKSQAVNTRSRRFSHHILPRTARRPHHEKKSSHERAAHRQPAPPPAPARLLPPGPLDVRPPPRPGDLPVLPAAGEQRRRPAARPRRPHPRDVYRAPDAARRRQATRTAVGAAIIALAESGLSFERIHRGAATPAPGSSSCPEAQTRPAETADPRPQGRHAPDPRRRRPAARPPRPARAQAHPRRRPQPRLQRAGLPPRVRRPARPARRGGGPGRRQGPGRQQGALQHHRERDGLGRGQAQPALCLSESQHQ